jgi:hypothetical protein
MTRRWLYRVVALGTVFGVAAVARHLFVAAAHGRASGVCLLHAATGAPCPACGTTRSVAAVLNGEWAEAWQHNPLGLVASAALIVLPAVAVHDRWRGREDLWRAYTWIETTVQRPAVAVPLLALLAAHWIRLILLHP